jgi:hypothetical protein
LEKSIIPQSIVIGVSRVREMLLATLSWTSHWDEKAQKTKHDPKLLASFGEIGNRFTVSLNAAETVEPTKEVQVPEGLAKRIFSLAALQKEIDEEQGLLGGLMEDAGLLHRDVEAPPK